LLVAFRKGLSESGYVEGQNVAIEYHWAEGQYHRLPALAAELARRPVAVIAALDGPAAVAAKAATTTIPIVFNTGIDPVTVGLVVSLKRPGGNLTGVNMIAGPLPAKQFGLLHEVMPAARIIALLINPNNANAERDAAIVQEAARAVGRQILVTRAATETDFETVFATLVQEGAGALLVNSDVFFTSQRDQIVALAARHAIPVMAAWREWPVAGGLMSYGPSLAGAEQQVGVYTGKILKGAKPADLPIIQPTTFQLVINFKTAKALALTIPSGVLAISDEVID
jgi:putative ABC transport system substrate-binding protein